MTKEAKCLSHTTSALFPDFGLMKLMLLDYVHYHIARSCRRLTLSENHGTNPVQEVLADEGTRSCQPEWNRKLQWQQNPRHRNILNRSYARDRETEYPIPPAPWVIGKVKEQHVLPLGSYHD